jgi:hypothetical protein
LKIPFYFFSGSEYLSDAEFYIVIEPSRKEMFNAKPNSRKSELKTVRVVTHEKQHNCSDDCFKPRKTRKPRGLRPINLGDIYQDHRGRFFQKWGKGDWLEVIGVKFIEGPGGLHLAFIPKEPLHIHSRGGSTTAQITEQYDDPGNEDYHAEAAAGILYGKKKSLREAREFLSLKASKVIPKSPKKKATSGKGRGAPGSPRTPRGHKISDLIDEGKSRSQVLSETLTWSAEHGEKVAGPFGSRIKQHVDRIWKQRKSSHK